MSFWMVPVFTGGAILFGLLTAFAVSKLLPAHTPEER